MYFTWKNEYSVGIQEIDGQHQKLFEIGRRVSNLLFSQDVSVSNEDILSVFHDLKEYAKYHFSYEEELIQKYGYPFFKIHKKEHDMIIERMQKTESTASESMQKDKLMGLMNLIFDWISHHILIEDKKYEAYLKKAGVVA